MVPNGFPYPFEPKTDDWIFKMSDGVLNHRLATFYYTDDGKTAKQQIWDETMKELSFAHVEEIVASMAKE